MSKSTYTPLAVVLPDNHSRFMHARSQPEIAPSPVHRLPGLLVHCEDRRVIAHGLAVALIARQFAGGVEGDAAVTAVQVAADLSQRL